MYTSCIELGKRQLDYNYQRKILGENFKNLDFFELVDSFSSFFVSTCDSSYKTHFSLLHVG